MNTWSPEGANPISPGQRPGSAVLLFGAMALLGGLSLVAGLVLTPPRTWLNILLASNFLIGLGLGGLLLAALHYVTGARWSLPLLRMPEAMTAVLPAGSVGLLAVLLFCPYLYSDPASSNVPESPLHRLWMNRGFFLARSVVYVGVWIAFAVVIVGNSRRQDRDLDRGWTEKNLRLSAFFLVAFGVTCWLSSTDWLMALDRNWVSTMFGVYNFAGLFLSALAAEVLLVLWLRRQSSMQGVVNDDHLHDLGTLLFGMSCFWMYTWYYQYMLIWFVNNPEETSYLRVRWSGVWPVWLFLDLALNWAIPFVVLLFRSAKRTPWILGAVALIVLAGRWVDLSLMILPTQKDAVQLPGVLEAGLLLGTVGVFLLFVLRGLRQAALTPRFSRH
jgi:hypothetical protein